MISTKLDAREDIGGGHKSPEGRSPSLVPNQSHLPLQLSDPSLWSHQPLCPCGSFTACLILPYSCFKKQE